jgi:hypothetical protein
MRESGRMSRSTPTTVAALLVAGLLAGCGTGDGAATTGLATPGAVPPSTRPSPSTAPAPPAGTASVPEGAPAPGTTTDPGATVPADQPVPCPSGEDGGAPGAFDARELEGRTLAQATATAKARGCSVRVARRDGEDLVLTQDLSTSRINVEVTDGRVTLVLGVA